MKSTQVAGLADPEVTFDKLQAARAATRSEMAVSTAASVTQVSPLAVDLMRAGGLDLAAIIGTLRSDDGTDRQEVPAQIDELAASAAAIAYATGSRYADVLGDLRFERRHRRSGVVLRAASDPAGCLGVRVVGGEVAIDAMVGRAAVKVVGGMAMVIVDLARDIAGDLDEIKMAQAFVSDEPLLAGRGYGIVGVVPARRLDGGDRTGQRLVIVLSTGVVGFPRGDMP